MEPLGTAHDPLEQQVVDNRYRLVRRIGSGGMSVVYLAERVGIGKPIAIKFLRSAFASLPDFVSRFEQEARACSRLNHLNCVSVIDFGVAFGSPYLVMEYVHGMLLNTMLSRGMLRMDRSIPIARQILAGLRHAHARGVIHRDLKPGNVMLVEMTGAADFVKIMDFGTAQILTGDGPQHRKLGTDVGTPFYMSPEQASGQPTDARTDVYALGVMLFEMLTGERPFVADDPMRVLEMHLKSPIPSVRVLRPELGISPELEALLRKSLQKRAEDRYASAEEMDTALQELPEVRPRSMTGPKPAQAPASARVEPPGNATGPSPAIIEPEPAPPPEAAAPAESGAGGAPKADEVARPADSGRSWVVILLLIAVALGGIGLAVLWVLRR
jgi:eukaryotic-like serine/threonine-protein kinase